MKYIKPSSVDEIARYGNNSSSKQVDRRSFLNLIVGGYAAAFAACRVGPTAPSAPGGNVVLQIYNASTGQSKDMTIEIPGSSTTALVNAADLAQGLSGVVTSEFAVRDMGARIGRLVEAAGPSANLPGGSYRVFIPSATSMYNGQSVYDCMPNPSLNGGKRDFVVGVLNKDGVDPNGLPWRVWTDAIEELNRNMVSENGFRYGNIRFDANASNPDFTVGFADNNLRGGGAWAEGYKNTFMAGPRSVFPLDYDRPTTKDSALEELFEMLHRHNNICSAPGTREVIGKAIETEDTQWGLNARGIDLLRRNFTRAP
jgi:hypothetical protein